LCLPWRVVIAGGMMGDGAKLDAAQREKSFAPTAQFGQLFQMKNALQLLESDDAVLLVKALR